VDEKEPSLREVKETDNTEIDNKSVAKKIEEKEKKNTFSTAIIVILSLVFLAGIGVIVFMLLPMFKGNTDVRIPDVSNLSIVEAEKALKAKGFEVKDETKKQYSENVEKGLVIGTEPIIGKSKPKGTTITLIESLGKNDKYTIEDYTGKNYIEVQTTLEQLYKMQVKIDKKEIEITPEMDLQLIIEQDVEPGTEVIVSEENPAKITLYIPDAYDQYPDFVGEGWTIDEIQAFADKYELRMEIKYEEDGSVAPGTVIKQSRTGKIVNGATFYITLAKEVTQKETPQLSSEEGAKPENTNQENKQ
jgi:serine/threonine-protein kinase